MLFLLLSGFLNPIFNSLFFDVRVVVGSKVEDVVTFEVAGILLKNQIDFIDGVIIRVVSWWLPVGQVITRGQYKVFGFVAFEREGDPFEEVVGIYDVGSGDSLQGET